MLAATQCGDLPVEGCPAFTLNTSASCSVLKLHLQRTMCLSTLVLTLQCGQYTPHPGTRHIQVMRQPGQQTLALR